MILSTLNLRISTSKTIKYTKSTTDHLHQCIFTKMSGMLPHQVFLMARPHTIFAVTRNKNIKKWCLGNSFGESSMN